MARALKGKKVNGKVTLIDGDRFNWRTKKSTVGFVVDVKGTITKNFVRDSKVEITTKFNKVVLSYEQLKDLEVK